MLYPSLAYRTFNFITSFAQIGLQLYKQCDGLKGERKKKKKLPGEWSDTLFSFVLRVTSNGRLEEVVSLYMRKEEKKNTFCGL